MLRKLSLLLLLTFAGLKLIAQSIQVTGVIRDGAGDNPIAFASVLVPASNIAVQSNSEGRFALSLPGTDSGAVAIISCPGYLADTIRITGAQHLEVMLQPSKQIEEVVITGTMRPVSRSESPIPVEVFTPAYFRKNPTPSLFDAVGMINGVRPQLNCNVCNTGDIHINGMEGPYTLILIDGMPIVSALSTVYGLNGIPNSIEERLEVVKGPAASLYGSEAMGGIINVITKKATGKTSLHADIMTTSWLEHNADLAFKTTVSKGVQTLLGINYYNYKHPYDKNKDGFTDITLQDRVSIFNKWSFTRSDNRVASIAARYVYEDRWGGQMDWSAKWRGSDSIYGESVYTKRWELVGQYQLPFKEKIMSQFSLVNHDQDSYYGNTSYQANQKTAFAQLYWEKAAGRHNLLTGASFRYTFYDDNTPGTSTDMGVNNPAHTPLPGIFVQDEWALNKHNKLLLGYRFDYDRHHGGIHSPRIAYKWSRSKRSTWRASFGTGFRVVNLFTEDHAALTGSRRVEIKETLNPERSYNGNLNYVLQLPLGNHFINVDATAFYGYFTNKITGDYLTDPNKIIYSNLEGYAISRGISLNTSMSFQFPLHIILGATYMDVFQVEQNKKQQQLFAPRWSGNFSLSYQLPRQVSVDLTGQVNGPMKLPLQQNDFRPGYAPLFCLANIQVTKKAGDRFEVYGGVKNLLNFVPQNTFMRPHDPFDKAIHINNPNGYTFDTEYNYAPIQGIKGFLGIRYSFL